jgi:hypothetical protein
VLRRHCPASLRDQSLSGSNRPPSTTATDSKKARREFRPPIRTRVARGKAGGGRNLTPGPDSAYRESRGTSRLMLVQPAPALLADHVRRGHWRRRRPYFGFSRDINRMSAANFFHTG